MSGTKSRFSFGEGIEYVLNEILFPKNTRETYNRDAQIIENAFIKAISRYDPMFRKAFRGLSLGGSYLDGLKIDLPDEFDMHVKIHLSCCEPLPVCVPNRPGFIFLRACSTDHPCVRRFRNEGYFINRLAVQSWFRSNITAVMPSLQGIRCSRRRVYNLEYTAHGYGVAHTLLAIEQHDRSRRISFDFVPVFEFEVSQWPRGLKIPINNGRTWFAVPRKYFDAPEEQDQRSFILCAPHWERLAIGKKQQNLKDSLRLMKAFRNANELGGLVSYFLKSIYLNQVQEKRSINWNQAPGRILIRMLVVLLHCLLDNHLPFYLAPDHNNLDKLSAGAKREYARIISRKLGKLIRRRDANYLTIDDITDLFGIE